jgi:hypothetical protein
MDALYARRAEITNQLEALKDRREDLVEQVADMRPDERDGHDARITVIDQRTAQLERDLFRTDDQISRALGNQVSEAGGGSGGNAVFTSTESSVAAEVRRAASNGAEDGVIGALAGTGTFLLFAFVAWKGIRRWIWKPKPVAVASGADQAVQIAQLQRSMDVIAVEVERISEAQRYVAKMLNSANADPQSIDRR